MPEVSRRLLPSSTEAVLNRVDEEYSKPESYINFRQFYPHHRFTTDNRRVSRRPLNANSAKFKWCGGSRAILGLIPSVHSTGTACY